MKTTTLTANWLPLVWVHRPSSEVVEDSVPDEMTLFSPASIFISTLVGGALAGFVLMAITPWSL